MSDLDRLRRTLAPVENAARGLPWARQRPWTVQTHVWTEGRLPVVDLHDLGRSQAREAVTLAAEVAGSLDAGALALVTGQGRRSIGRGVLRDVTAEVLRRHVEKTGGYYRPAGPGRWMLVVDPDRAPPAATGRLGLGWWVGAGLFLVALVLAVSRSC